MHLINFQLVSFLCRLVHKICEFNRIYSQHSGRCALEVDSNILLPALLLKMCSSVREGFFNNCGLDINESFLDKWSTNDAKVLRSSDKDLSYSKQKKLLI